MNILLVVREFSTQGSGGVSYHTHHLAKALYQLGHRVSILCDKNSSNSTIENPPKYISDIHTVNLSGYFPIQLEFNYRAKNKISELELTKNNDAVQYHAVGSWAKNKDSSCIQIYKAHMAFEHNIKLIIEEMIYSEGQYLKPMLLKFYSKIFIRYLEKNSVENVDLTIFNSKLTKNEIIHDSIRSAVIPNGVDTDVFNLRSNVKITNTNYFLFAGGDSLRKGINPLLNAWNKYQGPINNLIIVGSVGKYYDREYLSGIDGVQVRGLVERDELINLYNSATALIHPAYFEPFGNVVFESIACGTPVIVSNNDHVGAVDYLDDNCGITIDPNKHTTILKAMKNINSKKLYDSNYLHRYVTKYTWDQVAKRTIQRIKEQSI